MINNDDIYKSLSKDSKEILDDMIYCANKMNISTTELIEALKEYIRKDSR